MTDPTSLLGSWKLVSLQLKFSDNGQIIDLYGAAPLGFCLFDPGGRMMVVITPSGPRDARSFAGGYSGRYRVEDNELITQVDVATHPAQAGTEQKRSILLDGDTLTLVTPEQAFGHWGGPFGQSGNRIAIGTVVWKRERTRSAGPA